MTPLGGRLCGKGIMKLQFDAKDFMAEKIEYKVI
jgi:hypothetical protein